MTTGEVREMLAVLAEAGVRRASFAGGFLVEVEFAPIPFKAAPVTTTTFVDPNTGEPVDLNAGAPETAQPDVDEQIAQRNFRRGDV